MRRGHLCIEGLLAGYGVYSNTPTNTNWNIFRMDTLKFVSLTQIKLRLWSIIIQLLVLLKYNIKIQILHFV